MKTQLTKEQSQHLIELGVPEEKASALGKLYKREDDIWDYHRLFRLTDLLEILPNKISYNHDNCFLMIIRDVYGIYSVGYAFDTFEGCDFCYNCEFGGELIDALYKLTIWCIENKHLKL